MRNRCLVCVGVVAALTLCLTARSAAAPEPAAAPAKGSAPLTPWGEPDLQGLWTGNTITPLERPAALAGKEFLTPEEVAALEKRAADRATDRAPAAGDPGTYNQFWLDGAQKVVPSRRTSLVIDPPDGKVPYTAEGRQIQTRSKARYGKGPYDSWTDVDTGERCLTDGLPIHHTGYNNNYQIFQAPGYVAILHEYFHETRIIPTDGRPHGSVPQWLGDSRGHWEGQTLVVETTKVADKKDYEWADAWRASRATMRLVERFTRTDAETIDYQFTWEDPTMYTRPWTAAIPLSNNQAERGVTVGQMYEYACHEGNYAIQHILSGARTGESTGAAAKKGSK